MGVHWHTILWSATWGNNVAAIEWVAVTAIAGAVARRPLGRLARAVKRGLLAEVHEHAAAARADAEAARRIAADLYERHTGRQHPAAPKERR